MLRFKPIHLLLPILIVVSSWAQAAGDYSRVYVFGDSLSDTGNLASVIGGFPPPYYMNRVSNGPVAVEVLAEKLGLDADASLHLIGPAVGSNYAVAGANAYGDEAIDFNNQVLIFQANHGYVAPADALYVIFIGGNDVRSARDDSDPISAASTIDMAATQVKQAIMDLAESGARSFLVVNAPNISVIPETRLLATAFDDPELFKRATKLSKNYRVALGEVIEELSANSDLQITEFDLFKFLNKLIKKADSHGFTNITDACFSSSTFSFHPDCNFGQNADEFVFFDEIHPTARAHAIVGEAFYEAVSE